MLVGVSNLRADLNRFPIGECRSEEQRPPFIHRRARLLHPECAARALHPCTIHNARGSAKQRGARRLHYSSSRFINLVDVQTAEGSIFYQTT